MTPDKQAPPTTDPRRGRNAGYAEDQARDGDEARQKAIPAKPSPDEPGIDRDTDAQPDPASGA